MQVKPLDFLLIGAVKAGTTTLFELLRHHPSIFIPAGKEVYFFDNQERFALGWDNFAGGFYAGASIDQKWGKITPRYLSEPAVPARVAEMATQVRLIALLRNPVDRAISHYHMFVRNRPEYGFTLEEVVASGLPASPLEKPDPRYPNIWHYGLYGESLERYLCHFQREQLLVLFSDELKARPHAVLDLVLSHLGLDQGYRPANLGQEYHRGGRQRFPQLVPFMRKQMKPAWKLMARLPERQKEALKTWYAMRLNLVPETKPTHDKTTRQRLVEFYRPDVRKLEAILGHRTPWPEFDDQK
ncbi:MAG: sulfotransferase domain-containing protein [Caldilineaceae bacterium]|nr:sulfotransferase domain-containing protein [Caldilineaceae bacterium]